MERDRQLLDAWQEGDNQAGSALFERYFDAILRFFRGKVPESAVEELVQQTFLGCTESRDRFRGDSSFKGFLYGIARNKLLHFIRSRQRTPGFDALRSSIHDLEPSPSSVAAEQSEQRLLLEALRRIPLDLQIAVELHFWEGMSGRELAEALDIPEGTARSRLRRAREALEQQLAELAESKEQLRSTVTDLERWAKSLKDLVNG